MKQMNSTNGKCMEIYNVHTKWAKVSGAYPGSNAGIECLKIENKNQEIKDEGERNWKKGDIALDDVFFFKSNFIDGVCNTSLCAVPFIGEIDWLYGYWLIFNAIG